MRNFRFEKGEIVVSAKHVASLDAKWQAVTLHLTKVLIAARQKAEDDTAFPDWRCSSA